MWMAYSAQSWPVAVDVTSAVQRLVRELDAYAFEADHDAVYDLSSDAVYLHQLAKKYRNGVRCCQDFLDKKINYDEWKAQLIALKLEDFVEEVEEVRKPQQ